MRIKNIAIVLSVLAVFNAGSMAYAANVSTNDKEQQINENNNKIKDLENEKNQVKSEKNNTQKEIDDLHNKINEKGKILQESQSKIGDYENKINALKSNIKAVQDNISKKQKEIDSKIKEIELKQKEQEEKQDMLGKRLRSMYKSNPFDAMIFLMLESDSLLELVNKASTMSRIIKNDKVLINEVQQLKNELEAEKKMLEEDSKLLLSQKENLQKEQNALKETQDTLLSQKKEQEKTLDDIKVIEKQKNSKYSSLNASEKKLQDEIAALNEDNEQLQNELKQLLDSLNNNSNNQKPDSGNNNANPSGYIRPVSGPITSPFGQRIHPVTGKSSFHHGVDFGVPFGTGIKAARAGQVAFSGWYNEIYGNVVIINHGGGIQTLYAHASSVAVSPGASVNQGQVVAYVGSTGWSTGPHLHFEVRQNGQAINPMNYIK